MQNQGHSTNGSRRRSKDSRRKIRYAVVGLGYISQVAVVPAFAQAKDNSELIALVSGDATKLRKLARKYKVASTYSYEQYSDCLASGEIDAVYIGLPNNMHRAYTEGAAQSGIHVLCEKPMALTEQECHAMILLESQKSARPMKLTPVEVGERPTQDQEIQKPPIGKPTLVKAASPSK